MEILICSECSLFETVLDVLQHLSLKYFVAVTYLFIIITST